MRVLGGTLEASQKSMGDAVCKIVLTQQGNGNTYTYGVDTTNRLLDVRHKEQEWGQTAQVLVDNREGNLTGLALEGYTAVISYGYGTDYSASAPLTAIAQKTDSGRGELATFISLAGLFDLWGEQEATELYSPDEINTDTVKTILDAIATPTLACFSTAPNAYPAHTITYDSGYDDSIINSFTPKDNFSIAKGESRLSAFRKALAYTKCKTRVENDSGTATIHIFQPTITGETYDYEYNDAIAAANHNFFDKSVRKRLVLPNKVVVRNHPDHDDSYTGNATDASSYAALGNQYYTQTEYLRLASNAQAALIATAILQRYQIAAEKGHGFAPMNCGQEVMDYVKITDSVANDTRIGNIGFINRHYTPGRFEFEFRFGTLETLGLAGTIPPRQSVAVAAIPRDPQQPLREQVAWLTDMLESALQDMDAMRDGVNAVISTANATIQYLLALQIRSEIFSLSVTGRLQIPQGPNMFT